MLAEYSKLGSSYIGSSPTCFYKSLDFSDSEELYSSCSTIQEKDCFYGCICIIFYLRKYAQAIRMPPVMKTKIPKKTDIARAKRSTFGLVVKSSVILKVPFR